MSAATDDRLIDVGEYPEIYADGLADVEKFGPNARLMFFTWRKIDGVFRRTKSGMMIRPVETLSADCRIIEAALKAGPPGFTQLGEPAERVH